MGKEYSLIEKDKQISYRDEVEGVSALFQQELSSVDFIYPSEPDVPDFETIISEAMNNPIGVLPLREAAKGKKSAVILVSDATRAVATSKVLPYVVEELLAAGLELDKISLIVATGVHREATKDEMAAICGQFYGKIQITNHDPYTPEKLVVLGTTSLGNTAEVNKSAYEADFRISIGKVEPHEFAGFSGGRKSVLPGISSERCIAYNHRPEMILNSNSVSGILEGNPIHMDMLETARMLGVDFCISLVQNAAGTPLGIFAGTLIESHMAGIRYLSSIYQIELKHHYDIYLVTPGYPLDIDLYQSMKALIALTAVAKRDDTIVFYSRCSEGVNSEDMMKPFEEGGDVEEILKRVTANYRIQMDHALLLCKLYQKGVNIIACSPGVSHEVFSTLKMTPASDLDDALKKALARHTDSSRLAVIPTPQRFILSE